MTDSGAHENYCTHMVCCFCGMYNSAIELILLCSTRLQAELYFSGPSAGREDEFVESAALCLLSARLLVDLLFARMCTVIPDLRCVCMAGMMGLDGVFRVGCR